MRLSIPPSLQLSGKAVSEKIQYAKVVTASYTFRRAFIAGAVIISLYLITLRSHGPKIFIHSSKTPNAQILPQQRYNESKVALLIENRNSPILAPLLLHFISVVPPDWKFRFMGSPESVAYLNSTSHAIRSYVSNGKLDLTYIPSNMTTGSQEEISVFLTTLWLYETVLRPAEWLLVFQTDSILCANSRQDLNSYLDYDWVGAPWVPNSGSGGNGGLSLRRVSRIVEVLKTNVRVANDLPEDVFLSNLLSNRDGSRMANGTVSLKFSGELHSGEKERVTAKLVDGNIVGETDDPAGNGELIKDIDDWRDGYYEPMGYHIGNSGTALHSGIWGKAEARQHIWQYCPEIKMILQMDAEKFVPGHCGQQWKRDGSDMMGGDGDIYDLPPGLMPW